MDVSRPKMPFEVRIRISGLTKEDILDELGQIAIEFASKGILEIDSIGPSSSWFSEVNIDNSITPELYREQLDRYISSIREEKI
jgi:hypothetical protein